jgi:hypothetical protein
MSNIINKTEKLILLQLFEKQQKCNTDIPKIYLTSRIPYKELKPKKYSIFTSIYSITYDNYNSSTYIIINYNNLFV